MASPQGSSVQSELRIVIVGNAGDEKDKVVRSVLNCENLSGKSFGLCSLHQRQQVGRRIRVVEAPGWDRSSDQQKAEIIEEEVERSVSICPPGPHALLLVIPVKNLSEEPSGNEIAAAQTHMQLLSERVWKHTILLFACDEAVEETLIKQHIRSAGIILDKCGGRKYVLKSRTKISELFTMIEDLVEENHGDFFLPQAYYDLIQRKTEEAFGEREIRRRWIDDPVEKKRGDFIRSQAYELIPHKTEEASGERENKRRWTDDPLKENRGAMYRAEAYYDLIPHKTEEASGERAIKNRRGSLDSPPNLSKTESEEKKEAVEEAPKQSSSEEINMPLIYTLMGVVGALLGSVAGAQYGTLGACFGIACGGIIFFLLAVLIIYIYTRLYPQRPTRNMQ